MKTFISAVALATILSTPVLAEKTPVKPVDECFCHDDIALQVAIYHIDQMIMNLEEMRAELLREFPKPVDNDK